MKSEKAPYSSILETAKFGNLSIRLQEMLVYASSITPYQNLLEAIHPTLIHQLVTTLTLIGCAYCALAAWEGPFAFRHTVQVVFPHDPQAFCTACIFSRQITSATREVRNLEQIGSTALLVFVDKSYCLIFIGTGGEVTYQACTETFGESLLRFIHGNQGGRGITSRNAARCLRVSGR